MPFVSVIMPVYNSADTLVQAVRSVQAQDHTDWELLVTDDGSTDGSDELLADLAREDERIKPARGPGRSGAAGARNLAIDRAGGDMIAFLDADDMWLGGKLSRQLSFAEDTSAALTFTSYYKMSADYAGAAADFAPNDRVVHARPHVDYATMLQQNWIGCLTAMYDRRRVGTRLMPDLRKRQDYALWLSILRDGGRGYGLDEPLALYRDQRSGSLSSNKLSLVLWNWRLYRDVERLSVPRSVRALASTTVRSLVKSRI